MEKITLNELPDIFVPVAEIFAQKKEELCDMDAKMGDGDLGLTMDKGYGALPNILRENLSEGDFGKVFMKSGIKMASIVPSTMGTLMSSGLMGAGKELKGKVELAPSDFSLFYHGFAEGIAKRGKCTVGDCTIYDAVYSASRKVNEELANNPNLSFIEVSEIALKGASEGVEATKCMIPKFGKAAVFSAKANGIADQGAVAGYYLMVGIHNYFAYKEQ